MPESLRTAAPIVDESQPWLGLLPFKREHRRFFFGRDAEIAEILARIRENPLTVLFGQSGLGKTSLLGAAVAPTLEEAGFAPVLLRLDYQSSAPSLLEQTRAALRAALPNVGWPADAASTPLWELFHRLPNLLPAGTPPPVLIFDQFEEIFTLGRQDDGRKREAELWLEQVADLLQNRPPRSLEERFAANRRLAREYDFTASPIRIVFALREDFLSHLEGWKIALPLLTQNRMALHLLTGPQALQAVLGPASLGPRPLVDREVAAAIVRTVARVGPNTPLPEIHAVPPLLSLLCERLNAARLAANADEISAGMVSDRSADILQRFYDESFEPFPAEHREVIRALIEDPPMITEGGFRNSLVREDAEAQLARLGIADPRDVFDQLIQRRLITVEERDRIQRLEVTHDVLVPLLVRSRKDRRTRIARERAEREAQEVAARAEEQRRQIARARRTTLIVSILALFAAVSTVIAVLKARESSRNFEAANRARISAEEAKKRAEAEASRAEREADRAKTANEKSLKILHDASMGDYAVAVQRIERDFRWHEGVAHLVRALKWESGNELAAMRLYATLSHYGHENQNWPRMIFKHEGAVYWVQFSPDGSRVVSASADKTARIWNVDTGDPVGDPMRHANAVGRAQFSPDGSRIATGSADKTARIWDAATGKPIGEPMRHSATVTSLQFSSDGTRVVTADQSGIARVWDAATGKPLSSPMEHSAAVNTVEFSPDGSRVLTASGDHTAQVWDAATGNPLGAPLQHGASVASARFNSDGSLIVTAGSGSVAQIWDTASGKATVGPLRHSGTVTSARFSPDGTRVVTTSNDGLAQIWDAATGKLAGEPLFHSGWLGDAQFSPDTLRIVAFGSDKAVRIWETERSTQIGGPLQHRDRVYCAQFSPDGTRIVTASADKTVQVWDLGWRISRGEPFRHDGPVNTAQFSPDGTRIVTASSDYTAQIWDVATGKPQGEPMRHAGSVGSAQFSPDGNRIVTASADNTAQIWDAVSGKPVGERLRHSNMVSSAAFSPDGTRIVTACTDHTARVWNATTGQPIGEPLRHADRVNNAQFSPDGTRIVTVSNDQTARIWDSASGKQIGEPIRHDGRVFFAQFSPDGTQIITACEDNTARIWDAATGQPVGEPFRHDTSVYSARFNYDGTRLVTTSDDSIVRIWDIASGRLLGEPLYHWDSTGDAQFSPDGTRIVTACDNNTARIWNVQFLKDSLVPVPEWFLDRARAIAGIDFGPDGGMQTIAGEERRAVLLQNLVEESPWSVLARWLSLPPHQRTFTPGSALTPRQIAERERDTMRYEGIESALDYDPTIPLVRLYLSTFESMPKYAQFLREYDLKRLPDDPKLWGRAGILLGQNQPALAIHAARKAVSLDPNQIEGQRALAIALARNKQTEEAVAAYEQLLKHPEVADFDFANAGYDAANMGNADRSRAIFREGKVRFPNSPDLLRMEGRALILLNAPTEARQSFLDSLSLRKVPSTLLGLATARWLTDDREGAVADAKTYLSIDPSLANPDSYKYWPDAERIPAIQVLEETLRRHPELRQKPSN